MGEDVVYNKIETIKKCIIRINEEYDNNPQNLKNYTKQDAIILNIQRACQTSIDLAMHIISKLELGVPKVTREAFYILYDNNCITLEISETMQRMIGFRNLAVHNYTKIETEIIQKIIENHLDDFEAFYEQILKI